MTTTNCKDATDQLEELELQSSRSSPRSSLSNEDVAKICSWIEPEKRYHLRNIYRALTNGCKADIFHAICDDQGPTVIVAYTKSGYTFGVYTSLSFQSNSVWVSDTKMFLFVIRQAGQMKYCKYPAQKPELNSPPGIYQDASLGPTFGSRHGKEIQFFEDSCDRNPDGTIKSNIRVQLTGRAFQMKGIASSDIGGNDLDLYDIQVFKVEVPEPFPSLVDSDVPIAPTVKPKPSPLRLYNRTSDFLASGGGPISPSRPGRLSDKPIDTGPEIPDELLLRPWRENLVWKEETKVQLKETLRGYSPCASLKVPSVKILLTGEIASGKSSFINTVIAGMHTSRSIPSFAITGESTASQTRKYRSQMIRTSRDEEPLHFEICDTMGMESTQTIHNDDIANIVDGHCKDGYEFHSDVLHKIDKDKYRRNPKLKHKVHVGVLVISATSIQNNYLRKEVVDQLRFAKKIFDRREIVTLVLLTKIDKVSSLVAEDIRRVFRSKLLKRCVDETSQLIGISPKNIWPVKNYHEETRVNTYVDILALDVLQEIVFNADSFLSNYRDAKKKKK